MFSQLFQNVYYISGGHPKFVRDVEVPFVKGDVIGCSLDLSVPQITFSVNGIKVQGVFKDFNVDSLFFPVVSMSAAVGYYLQIFYKVMKYTVKCFIFAGSNFLGFQNWTSWRGLKFAVSLFVCTVR